MVLVSGILGREHGESSHVLVCLATGKQSSYAFWMISSQTAAGAEAVLFTVFLVMHGYDIGCCRPYILGECEHITRNSISVRLDLG